MSSSTVTSREEIVLEMFPSLIRPTICAVASGPALWPSQPGVALTWAMPQRVISSLETHQPRKLALYFGLNVTAWTGKLKDLTQTWNRLLKAGCVMIYWSLWTDFCWTVFVSCLSIQYIESDDKLPNRHLVLRFDFFITFDIKHSLVKNGLM